MKVRNILFSIAVTAVLAAAGAADAGAQQKRCWEKGCAMG